MCAVLPQQLTGFLAHLFLCIRFPNLPLHLFHLHLVVVTSEKRIIVGRRSPPIACACVLRLCLPPDERTGDPCEVVLREVVDEGPPGSPVVGTYSPTAVPHVVLRLSVVIPTLFRAVPEGCRVLSPRRQHRGSARTCVLRKPGMHFPFLCLANRFTLCSCHSPR